MGFEITDGKGRGFNAGVSINNRLLTLGVNESLFVYSAEEGDAYFVGSPLITLTDATESAILYLKNNEDDLVIIENFFATAEASTGGTSNNFRLNFYKNPTSISSGTTFVPLNQNFASSDTLDADAEYGAQGSTQTGGSLAGILSLPLESFNNIPANLVLGKGSSVAITVTPPASNTSMAVQASFRAIIYRELY